MTIISNDTLSCNNSVLCGTLASLLHQSTNNGKSQTRSQLIMSYTTWTIATNQHINTYLLKVLFGKLSAGIFQLLFCC